MDLPVNPPLAPMLAKAVTAVPAQPEGDPDWSYEPKWDGFRALIFRDGDEVAISSRGGKCLARYFPELVEAAKRELPEQVVVDGEVGVPQAVSTSSTGGMTSSSGGTAGARRLDWDALSQRIHPAASRIAKLADETPAIFIGFDALAVGDRSLLDEPFAVRRGVLDETINTGTGSRLFLSRTTRDAGQAQDWFTAFEGAGLDGVVAKRLDGRYVPGKREMLKIKHKRTADCVVVGYRVHKSGTGLGSMLLGLFDDDGEIRIVGGASAFSDAKRLELQQQFESLRLSPEGVVPGEASRWRSSASGEWIPIRQELVAEVAYDQMESGRFRHTVKFLRWRPDRDPASCTYDQLEVPLTYDLFDVIEEA